jgi:hypothetical protein
METMAQLTEMMQDPQFQEQVMEAKAAVNDQMAELMQDPKFVAQAKLYAKQMKQMMRDPRFAEQVNLAAEEMMASLAPQTDSNALASLLLAANPAAPRMSTARSATRQVKNVRMDEPGDKAVTLGAAALGAGLGVWLTGELTTAAVLSAGAAYATTLDNGFGSATKSAGSFAAKAYDKTVEINEEYDLLPKAKGVADAAVNVAGNLNKNYGITDKIDEKLKLGAALDKATDKFDELKSKVDDVSSKAKSS